MKNKKHNIVYEITNNINNKVYRGVHSTNDIEDDYMGSSKPLNNSMLKHGKENFSRKILFDFDTKEEAYLKEAELVDEKFVKRSDTYNVCLGGKGCFGENTTTKGRITTKDKNGNTQSVFINDPRYLSGELVSISKGTCNMIDDKGNITRIDMKDPLYKFGELKVWSKDKVNVKDKEGNNFQIEKNDPRYLSGELKFVLKDYCKKDLINVKYKDGRSFGRISKTDPRYLSGELVHTSTNKKWITKNKLNKIINSMELDEWLNKGWEPGRYINKRVK